MAHHAHDSHHDGLGHHITPLSVYWTVFAALMVLTVVTVAVSVGPTMLGISMGGYAIWVALIVASCKATLVATFFMHLKYDERFNALIFVSCLFFMGVFFAFTMMDVISRDAANPEEAQAAYCAENPSEAACTPPAPVIVDTEAEAVDEAVEGEAADEAP